MRDAGPGAVLLCAVGLGQVRITDLKDDQRDSLRNQIDPKAISPTVNEFAIRCGLVGSVHELRSLSSTVVASQDDSVDQTLNCRTTDLLSNHPDLTAQEQRVIGYAALHGITNVFDEYLCGAIRRVEGDMKAAVTMTFPLWGGLVHCLMSLDICESNVEQLAMALFGAQVKWVDQVLHVVLNEGIMLIIPNSEATLKGVQDDAIIRIFGPNTYGAINESPVRKRESAEGKRVTECVSMILTKDGAIINLSLGLEEGFQLYHKLYS